MMPEKRQQGAKSTTGSQRSRYDQSNVYPALSVPTSAESRHFKVLRPHEILQHDRVALSKPQEIAYFSKNGDNKVYFNRSNLSVYKKAAIGSNLLDGFQDFTSKDERDPTVPAAPIAPLLAALEHFQGDNKTWKQPHVITYRNNLNKIMGTPYNSKSSWTFDVEKRNGCVYFNVQKTPQDIENIRNQQENQRHGAFAGRRFEIYSTHAKPGTLNDGKQRVVNEDEEYCSISAMTLGDKRLVVAAEIDCCSDKSSSTREYIELKTFRLLQRENDQFVFERFKLLAFWIQSFLVGTPKIVVAFRDDEFCVQKLQSFQVTEIPSFCRKHWVRVCAPICGKASPMAMMDIVSTLLHEWSSVVCLNFTKTLLDWICEHAVDGRVYRVTYIPWQHVIEMKEEKRSSRTSFLPAQS